MHNYANSTGGANLHSERWPVATIGARMLAYGECACVRACVRRLRRVPVVVSSAHRTRAQMQNVRRRRGVRGVTVVERYASLSTNTHTPSPSTFLWVHSLRVREARRNWRVPTISQV